MAYNSPNSEGTTAITAWMLTCLFFVFGDLGSYALLLWRKNITFSLKKHQNEEITDKEEANNNLKNKNEQRSRMDDFCLIFFPGTYG